MAPVMSRYDSRARAAEAYELRTAHHSWREICTKLGFRSVGAAQTAVNRHVARMGREPTETCRQTREDSIRLRSRALGERFAVAYVDGDDDKLVMLNRELARNDSELAKLQGLYAPERAEVSVTVSAAELRQRVRAVAERADAERAALLSSAVIDAEVVEVSK